MDAIKLKIRYGILREVATNPNVKDGTQVFKSADGWRTIFCTTGDQVRARTRDFDEYYDEVVCEDNECAVFWRAILTERGNVFVWWSDSETQDDFITFVGNLRELKPEFAEVDIDDIDVEGV